MDLQNPQVSFTALTHLETLMKKLILPLILLATIPGAVLADDKAPMQHNGKMDHSQHMTMMAAKSAQKMPQEFGQSGFAAIAEIVQMLSDNPDTDWSKVNINALRNHLLDMDRLVTGAKVDEQPVDGGMRFNVTGEAEVLSAIQNMVPAHAMELARIPEYSAATESIDNGVALTVTGTNEQTTAKIKGLGFFGLMATGSHHQPHHFGMATGQGHGGMSGMQH